MTDGKGDMSWHSDRRGGVAIFYEDEWWTRAREALAGEFGDEYYEGNCRHHHRFDDDGNYEYEGMPDLGYIHGDIVEYGCEWELQEMQRY